MKNFLIYAHYLNGECHYVGCGNHNRPWDMIRRNDNWKKVFSTKLPKVVLLGEADDFKEALKIEAHHIQAMKTAGHPLANKPPAKYWLGKKRDPEFLKRWIASGHTPEARAKQAEAKRGIPLSSEHKAKISAAGIGRKLSEESKRKIGLSNKGKSPWNKNGSLTEEHKAKIGAAHKGKKTSRESIEKGLKTFYANGGTTSKAKQVRCLDTGNIYRSAGDAAKELGYSSDKGIWKVVSGTRPTYKGLRWEYCNVTI